MLTFLGIVLLLVLSFTALFFYPKFRRFMTMYRQLKPDATFKLTEIGGNPFSRGHELTVKIIDVKIHDGTTWVQYRASWDSMNSTKTVVDMFEYFSKYRWELKEEVK